MPASLENVDQVYALAVENGIKLVFSPQDCPRPSENIILDISMVLYFASVNNGNNP